MFLLGYEFHRLFVLFVIVFVKIQCDETSETSFEFTTVTKLTTTLKMDDLRTFNMSYYCKFQPNTRSCADRRTSHRYFFDIKLKRCVQFDYGHCNNSFNMFDGRHLCLESCRDEAHAKVSEDVTFNVFCRYQPDFGDCNSYHPMWYFDISNGKCKGFAYSGCGGNQNRFRSAMACLDVCGLLYTNKYD